MKKLILLVGIVCGFTSCSTVAPFQKASAGEVGCMPDDVAISDTQSSVMSGWQWRATCHEKRFVCGQVQTGTAFGFNAKCTEELRQPAQAKK